ncbi:MAG: formate dehydrogenase accessory protein FdhE [Ilumatobacter sp.]|nr:formate dehydrogenase accessory protein FdhE [Ilumatobacter sp.]
MSTAASTLLDLAEIRWTELASTRADLRPAITMQRSLVTRTIDAVERLAAAAITDITLEPALAATKLRAASPVLRGEVLALPVDLLGPLVLQACDDLADGGAGDVARHVRACIDAGRVDMSSLLAASFDRNQNAIRVKALHESIAPDVLWLAAELAVGPAAYIAQRAVFAPGGGEPHASVVGALGAWPHGYCPACGSWPAFGEASDGEEQLRCSFCGLGWRRAKPGCTYCDSEELTAVKTDPGEAQWAELCGDCGAYLKWLAPPAATPFELLPIEDLASMALDVLAAEQGFGRPSLPDLGGPERLPCEGLGT